MQEAGLSSLVPSKKKQRVTLATSPNIEILLHLLFIAEILYNWADGEGGKGNWVLKKIRGSSI